MKKTETALAAAGAAWTNGLEARQRGALETARLWLERAVKLAPGDPRIALDLANLRIALKTPAQLAQAAADLAGLFARYPAAPVALGWLSAEHLRGRRGQAAAALAALLQNHSIPEDADFPAVALMISHAAGIPGWCGLKPDGQLQIGPGPADVVITLDGAVITAEAAGGGFFPPPGRHLRVTRHGQDLAGSPLDLMHLGRCEGIVSVVDGGLTGWLHSPAGFTSLSLTLIDASGTRLAITPGNRLPPDELAPFTPKFSFTIAARKRQALAAPLRLLGPDGRQLMGSPVDPDVMSRFKPVPVSTTGTPVTTTGTPVRTTGTPVRTMPQRRPLAIVIPAYRNLALTQACIAAVQAAAAFGTRIILIDDATPEPAMRHWLDAMAATREITLIRHAENRGFPAAANAGLQAAGGHDVLLLNSDTLIPPGAIEALTAAAYADPDIGTVTPFSNDGTILSYPALRANNPAPDLAQATALQRAAAAGNGDAIAEIPTGVGFCLFIRHDCLAATGLFRGEIFAQGYGEENDFCLRARHAGFRNVAALGAYVAHHGRTSFGAAGQALCARNVRILNQLHPGYDAMIADFIAADPLAPARHRFDAARLAARRGAANPVILLISHNHGGGVARVVAAEMQKCRAAGGWPLLLVPGAPADPEATPFPWDAELTDGAPGDYPNLRFTCPKDRPALLALLARFGVSQVVLHHGLGHHPGIRTLASDLGVPLDIVLHDYASFCPRVNLLTHHAAGEPLRYCGEPDVLACVKCVASAGDETFEDLGPAALIARSKAEFAAARRITTPSADAANRIARHFPGIKPIVTPWEDDQKPVSLSPPKTGARRIAIIGGIGPAKGFDLLIACARDAGRRKLPLDFIVAGASADDAALAETGRIFVTGAYPEGQATSLIRSLQADLAFLPSIWPETWCFALSEAWTAGLYTIAFDLGAQAARLRATGRGALLPLGLPVPRINDMLLAWQPDLREGKSPVTRVKSLEIKAI